MRLKKEVYLSNRSHDNFSYKWETKLNKLVSDGWGNSPQAKTYNKKMLYHQCVVDSQNLHRRLLTEKEKKAIYKKIDDFFK